MLRVTPFAAALLLLCAAPSARADGQEPARTVAKASLDQEVQGTCETPREAMLQLLYWVQVGEGRVDLARASACMDAAGLTAAELEDRAYKLKRTLDLRGLYIDLDALPAEPGFADDDGRHRYRLPALPEIEIVRAGDDWVFSAATVRRVPGLYADNIPPRLDRILRRLPSWFHSGVFGVAVWQLLGLFLIVLIGVGVQRLVIFLLNTYVQRLAGRLQLRWLDKAAGRVARPVGGLAMAGVFYLFVPWLQFASVRVNQVARVAIQVLVALSLVTLVFRLIDVLSDWLDEKADRTTTKLDDQLIPLLRKTLKLFTALVGGIFVLQNLDVDVGSLLAGLGIGGLAFALAAKDSIANIFGSLVIFVDKPFQIGDWVVIGGSEGVVEEVGFRTTKIRTFYNSLVTMPNAKMTDTAIDNYGMRRYRRYSTTLGIAYSTPPELVEGFCAGVRAIIERLPGMRRDFYLVEFKEFGASSLDIMLYCFMDVKDWAEELRVRTNLNLEIMRLAASLGVSFAFPTRTLHIESQAVPAELASPPPLDATALEAILQRFRTGADGGSGGGAKRSAAAPPAKPAS